MNALEELVAACEREFAGPDMDDFEDDVDVSYPPSGITFGMIRRARAALTLRADTGIDGVQTHIYTYPCGHKIAGATDFSRCPVCAADFEFARSTAAIHRIKESGE